MKKLVFVIALILFTAFTGGFAFATCEAKLKICQNSCNQRDGVYYFSCYGPDVQEKKPIRNCMCIDEVDRQIEMPISAKANGKK